MQAIGFVIFLAVGLIQVAATIAGVEGWLGLPGWLAVPVSLFLGYVPLLGSVLGFLGAVKYWGWAWGWAALLFGGGIAAVPLIASASYFSDRIKSRRMKGAFVKAAD